MFVWNSNKLTLSVITNPSIMKNIFFECIFFTIVDTSKKNWYLFMLNDKTCQHFGIFFCLQNKNFKFTIIYK
jgi:hypothetical protein